MFEFDELKLWALCEVFRRLNNLKRWSSIITESGRNELAKQALNIAYCYILANEYEEKTGNKLNWNLFPRIAAYRAFQKAYVNFDIQEDTLHRINDEENSSEMFNEITEAVIEREMGIEFCLWLKAGCGTFEEKVYKAATKIATLIEFKEIKRKINYYNYEKISKEIEVSSDKYRDIPGFDELLEEPNSDIPNDNKPIKVLRDISRLRNRDRWSVYSYNTKCSVLGHLFDTALIAYLVSLEKGYSEEEATKNFFIGVFHDVPEVYTGDIPSPVKDYIKGFRKKSEEFENREMNDKFYPFLSKHVADAVRDVMIEEGNNKDRKSVGKVADYVSAVSELHRQAIKGSHDRELYKALVSHKQRLHYFGATQTEIIYYNQVEKFCRKTMLLDEVDYYLVWVEIAALDIQRAKKTRRIKKLYSRLAILELKLKELGADDFAMKKCQALKEKCKKYLP